MNKVIKQILEIDHLGMTKFLVMEIKPFEKNRILYKWQAQIFPKITPNFVPSDLELNKFNDFIVREISRAKNIIPTFKDSFDKEITLIIPNELQTISFGVQELKLYPTFDGKYWINDNLLKGFKEEILDNLKSQLKHEIITNFNLTELVINNQVLKLKNHLKDLETGVSHVDVKYRLTKISRTISDSLVKAINNLKLKVVYIWSEQDLLSFKISQKQIMQNQFLETDKVMIYDWQEDQICMTLDYLGMRKTFQVPIGTNQIFYKVNRMLNLATKDLLVKKYFTQTLNLSETKIDNLMVLKLKTINKNELNMYRVKDLKEKLAHAFIETLHDIRDLLYFQFGINDIDLYKTVHFGSLNQIKGFASFIETELGFDESYASKNFVYEITYQQAVRGLYNHDYELLVTMSEWMKLKLEKTLQDRELQVDKQATFIAQQEHLLRPAQLQKAAYNKQKYPVFNKKIEKEQGE